MDDLMRRIEHVTLSLKEQNNLLETRLEEIQLHMETGWSTMTDFEKRRVFRAFDRMQRAIDINRAIGELHKATNWTKYTNFGGQFPSLDRSTAADRPVASKKLD